MKNAVVYGAGNIGRGFIGQIFYLSGYQVTFIDVALDVIDAINQDQAYPIRIIKNESYEDKWVKQVRAISGMDQDKVNEVIAEADIMATAVGVNILPKMAPILAKALAYRWENSPPRPLNIIICENKIEADIYLKNMVKASLEPMYHGTLAAEIGFVEASIGRMVPVQTAEMKADNFLRICVEEYDQLPVDKQAFKGEIPDLYHLEPFTPFSFYIRRKLFVHNLGHAITAYLGYLKGYHFIYESINDLAIAQVVRGAMMSSAEALAKDYDFPLAELQNHVEDLLQRFKNKGLKDTNLRVGGDLARKMGSEDRLIGALHYSMLQNVDISDLVVGIAAASLFDPETDSTAGEIQKQIQEKGLTDFLKNYSQIKYQPVIDHIFCARKALLLGFS